MIYKEKYIIIDVIDKNYNIDNIEDSIIKLKKKRIRNN
jgi:hypothetical protein